MLRFKSYVKDFQPVKRDGQFFPRIVDAELYTGRKK